MLTQTQFGKRLKHVRDELDFSQQQVADALGISKTAVVQIEKGERSVSTVELAKLSDLYRLPISVFFESVLKDEEPEKDQRFSSAEKRSNLTDACAKELRRYSLCLKSVCVSFYVNE